MQNAAQPMARFGTAGVFRRVLSSAIALAAGGVALCGVALSDDNWPQWRGPHGNGVADAAHLPTTWSDTENIVWKIDLPAFASSTPVIWGDRLFLITPEEGEAIEPPETGSPDLSFEGPGIPPVPAGRGGARAGYGPGSGARGNVPGVRIPGERVGPNPGGSAIYLWCIDKNTGEVLWKHRFADGNLQARKGNMANPSPTVDNERVYALAGTGNLAAYDFTGRELWKRDVQSDTGPFGLNFCYASSPLSFQDRLIVAVLHGSRTDEPSYLLAYDKATGEPIWKTVRPTDARSESPDAYTSPQMLERNGKFEVVINGGDIVTGHDAMTGKELWRVEGLNPKKTSGNRIVPSVTIAANGLIFAPNKELPVLALDSRNRDEQDRPKLLWQTEWGPDVASPVSDGNYLWIFAKDNLGILACHDARSGQPVYYRQRLEAGGYHTASLLLADGKIYATNENAETTVLAATPEYKVLARNTLDSAYTIASLAVSGNRIYIRTGEHLYCIGEKASAAPARSN